MNNATLLKLHRWTSLVFALPLIVVLLTGLILSFEPIVQDRALDPALVNADRVTSLIQRFDPDGRARGLSISAVGQRLQLQGTPAPAIDLVTGEAATTSDVVGSVILWSRRTHEHLFDQEWLLIASTIAMVAIMIIGTLMGLPRLRNSLAGWHKGMAWFTIPLLLLSPITALLMLSGITFQGAPPPAGKPLQLIEAVRAVAQSHDLTKLTSLRNRGGRVMARIYEDGELRAYTVTTDGVAVLPRNWPRLLHEGNWFTLLSGSLNVITSVVLIGLLGTGLVMWGRRKLRPRTRRPVVESGTAVGPAA
ncbi:putative iron-regulated membrane protein [Rhodopseudomonas rhenobacensis]|uniref:Putative iron-regulated membrane protein n=1 Tax=Rhodopseudomonas rhenobacensis TaxID=87461 RepID=A0A7W7Z6L9_9BRAD|nr:PepSY-associated TM helix domain-containing protein [Rhodopseudomonas rhenobacensis]MBB5048823.1 putative iron-regulated membrane protein [Rhodopseudomonas rhenobacensis]